jgi:hypothetical protein
MCRGIVARIMVSMTRALPLALLHIAVLLAPGTLAILEHV